VLPQRRLCNLHHPMKKVLPDRLPEKTKERINLINPNATRKEQHKLQSRRSKPFYTTMLLLPPKLALLADLPRQLLRLKYP
jgi:hypothetical protein